MEITKLNKNLFVGGDPMYSDDLNLDIGKISGVDLVIDLREETDEGGWEEFCRDFDVLPDTRFVRVTMYDDGFHDNGIAPFLEVLEIIINRAEELEIDEKQLPVFVHCHMGVNRSPSMAMFLLMMVHELLPIEAFELIRQKRPVAGISYAKEAVATLGHITNVPALKLITASMWNAYEKDYWTQDKIQKINKYIRAAHQQGTVYTDQIGRLHATANRKKKK